MAQEGALIQKLAQFYSQHALNKGQQPTAQTKEIIRQSKEKYELIDLRTGELFAIQDATTVYQCGFDGIRFIELQIDANQKFSALPNTSPTNDIILVSKETQLINELKLYNGVKHININSPNKTILNLVQGTPGCGKTTFILKNYKKGDLVLFPAREGAEDLDSATETYTQTAAKTMQMILFGHYTLS